jgi:radical SAM superfamily enzyme YgiQ (UPF0313 family)
LPGRARAEYDRVFNKKAQARVLIYLADTVHRATRLYPDTVPYNVARIAAYTQQQHPQNDYRLFKDPDVLLDTLRKEPPDILALSNYFWNTELNHRIARYARQLHPDLAIVTGGPNLDRNREAYLHYSTQHPYVDFVVVEEGETAFNNIVTAISASGSDRPDIKSCDIPGTVAVLSAGNIYLSPSQPRIKDLDDFPSPYLNGMLTPFLEMGLRPILETVRGCPYQCAFCEQGSEFFTKIARLTENRLYQEIEFIRARTSAPELILADVNFGILKRDFEVASFLKKSHLEHGWPKSLYVYNAKQPTESTLHTMETLYPMAQLCMSFQSTDKQVLENIHRSNIGYDKYSFITRWAKNRGIPVGTELIYGLPGETRQTFVDGYDTLLDLQADYMASFNLRLFAGIELNTPAKRRDYGVRTRFRPMDVNLGEYEFEQRERIIEIEEIVYETATLSDDDFFFTRRLAFLIETLWNTGYLRPALAFLANHGFKITEILQNVLQLGRTSSAGAFFEEYDRLARDELAISAEKLRDRLTDERYWDDLVNGRGDNVKLNLAFAGRLLLFANPFDDFFYEFLDERYGSLLPAANLAPFRDVLAHCRASKVDLDSPMPRSVELRFDVPEWVRANCPKDLTPFESAAPVSYTYAINTHGYQVACKVRDRLERQGARINNIAERIFVEVAPVHRGPRKAVRVDSRAIPDEAHSDTLEKRMTWAS